MKQLKALLTGKGRDWRERGRFFVAPTLLCVTLVASQNSQNYHNHQHFQSALCRPPEITLGISFQLS